MSMPFDATMKDLGRDNSADFLVTFYRPVRGVISLLNPDLSTVTTAADFVLGVGDPLSEVIHFDFQSSPSAWKHASTLVYNALLYSDYHVPIHSIVILLRPEAAHANLNGTVNYAARPKHGKMNFRYEVVRIWEWPAERLLSGPLGTAVLAVLGSLPEDVSTTDGLTAVVERLIERIGREAEQEQGRKLLTAAFVLSGLRVNRAVALRVFRGVQAMQDSDTFLYILEQGEEKGLKKGLKEGQVKEAKNLLLRLGKKRFGDPDKATAAQLSAIGDLRRLHRIQERMFEATSWQDLLDTP
jgi:predicted transposase YdaD